jgi:hypothetical protein
MTSATQRAKRAIFRIVGDNERDNKRNTEGLEGDFCIIGDNKRNDKRNTEGLEEKFPRHRRQ